MKFEPKSEEKIIAESLLQPAHYESEIYQAKDAVSKNGNDMIHLKLRVFGEYGGTVLVDDYVVASMPLKLRHAAEACGLLNKYETGELNAQDFIGKCPKVKVGIQKDKEGKFADKNVIYDYLPRKPEDALAPALNDEIPF